MFLNLTKKGLTRDRAFSKQTRKAVSFLCNDDVRGEGMERGWGGERERQRLRAEGETAYREVFHKHRVPFNECGLSLSYEPGTLLDARIRQTKFLFPWNAHPRSPLSNGNRVEVTDASPTWKFKFSSRRTK